MPTDLVALDALQVPDTVAARLTPPMVSGAWSMLREEEAHVVL
jgi:hypothetical protein